MRVVGTDAKTLLLLPLLLLLLLLLPKRVDPTLLLKIVLPTLLPLLLLPLPKVYSTVLLLLLPKECILLCYYYSYTKRVYHTVLLLLMLLLPPPPNESVPYSATTATQWEYILLCYYYFPREYNLLCYHCYPKRVYPTMLLLPLHRIRVVKCALIYINVWSSWDMTLYGWQDVKIQVLNYDCQYCYQRRYDIVSLLLLPLLLLLVLNSSSSRNTWKSWKLWIQALWRLCFFFPTPNLLRPCVYPGYSEQQRHWWPGWRRGQTDGVDRFV